MFHQTKPSKRTKAGTEQMTPDCSVTEASSTCPSNATLKSSHHSIKNTSRDDDIAKNDSDDNNKQDTTNQLTPYEIYRAQNIERNQHRLLALGLVTDQEAKRVIDTVWGRRNKDSCSDRENIKKRSRLTVSEKIQGKKRLVDCGQQQWEEAWV